MGKEFHGCYDLLKDELILFDRGKGSKLTAGLAFHGLEDPELDVHLPHGMVEKLREEAHLAFSLSPQFEVETYREGHLTPVFFGSAVNNFGVLELLDGLASFAPSPRPQPTDDAPGAADRGEGHRLRLQDPGEHGSQAPRPHRLRAPLLGPLRARHEA